MAESEPSRVLNISHSVGNDSQEQYVEVGSNMFLGIKDGIKYTLVEASDSKYRLVEALSDSSTSLNSPNSLSTPIRNEKRTQFQDGWIGCSNEPKIIKLMALKSGQLPCKGQGDEIGNSVISPTLPISSFKEPERAVEKVTFEETPTDQDGKSQLTYTTLLPRQERKETWDDLCYPTPGSSNYNYNHAATFPHPTGMRTQRFMRRNRMNFNRNTSFSPIPRVRLGAPRQRRPRRSMYQYTPQILHSTPNNLSDLNPSSDSQTSFSDNSSGIQNTSNFNNTSQSSIEYPRVPNNTPNSGEIESMAGQKMLSFQWVSSIATGAENYISLDPRETHNEKERKRRLRIKNACQSMRRLLPYLVEKIDNASVFEQAVCFISFMRGKVGNELDMEFLEDNFVF